MLQADIQIDPQATSPPTLSNLSPYNTIALPVPDTSHDVGVLVTTATGSPRRGTSHNNSYCIQVERYCGALGIMRARFLLQSDSWTERLRALMQGHL